MRHLLLLLSGFLIFSCGSSKNNKQIELSHSLGTVIIDLPSQFNKYSKSFHQSDCGRCCETISQTFYDSLHHNLPIQDTFGWFGPLLNDSSRLFSFTVTQPASTNCSPSDFNLKDDLDSKIFSRQAEFPNVAFIDTAIVQIGKQEFMLVSTSRHTDGFYAESVEALTYFKNEPVIFTFEYRGNQSLDFIAMSKEALFTTEFH